MTDDDGGTYGGGAPGGRPAVPADPTYVEARRVLLDALEALAPHRRAVVVVGAQAVYLRTGDADLAVAPYTTDADLALDPQGLADVPLLEAAMRAAGFGLDRSDGVRPQPGTWVTTRVVGGKPVVVPVDLLVPEAFAPPGGRRGARLVPHGSHAARKTPGLEAALVDHGPVTIAALDPADPRRLEVEVATPAALLVAKLHKIADRLRPGERRDRLEDKDAADVVRLMQTTDPAATAASLRSLLEHALAGPVTAAALDHLRVLFGSRRDEGVRMAQRALLPAVPEERVAQVVAYYVGRLLEGPA